MGDFGSLKTEAFRQRMRPAAVDLYNRMMPGCEIEDLREDGVKVHALDKHFAIDTLAVLPSEQWISIQEKYRKHKFLCNRRYRVNRACPDFTQEYKNASGTSQEEPGEWFHLGAQFYFYGWADKSEDGFAAWVLLDIAKYKMVVRQEGGLDNMGRLRKNSKHGKASFYCIPVLDLQEAFIASHLPEKYLSTAKAQ